jgi:hypothetical protein
LGLLYPYLLDPLHPRLFSNQALRTLIAAGLFFIFTKHIFISILITEHRLMHGRPRIAVAELSLQKETSSENPNGHGFSERAALGRYCLFLPCADVPFPWAAAE